VAAQQPPATRTLPLARRAAAWDNRAAIEPVALKCVTDEPAVGVGEAPGLDDALVNPPEQPATADATSKPATPKRIAR
jgi:hypothetical protein